MYAILLWKSLHITILKLKTTCGQSIFKIQVIIWPSCASIHSSTGEVVLTLVKVRKRAKIRYRYNQAPHLNRDTNGKVTTSQLDTTNESQKASPFPAGDQKAPKNRRARKHNKNKTDIT